MLALTYYQKRGEDLPIIPMYVSNEKRRLIVGTPKYAREMERSGMKKGEIASALAEEINKLYEQISCLKAEIKAQKESRKASKNDEE